ncbi:MAG TPA: hypothetical protein PLD24_12570 [Macellibacteroides fermentans]|nr:hypothetical protein [Macellibacteroides fermentans]
MAILASFERSSGEIVFTLFAILFFFIGVIISGIGIVGEYVGLVYQEVRKRPRYVVRKTYGFDEQAIGCNTENLNS